MDHLGCLCPLEDLRIEAQPPSVNHGFTRRGSFPIPLDPDQPSRGPGLIEAKYLTRPQRTLALHIHGCSLLFGSARLPDGSKTYRPPFQPVSEEHLGRYSLHLNHYQVQSLDFFMQVKATRGDVGSAFLDRLRDRAYFEQWDLNDMSDTELAELNSCGSVQSGSIPR